MGESVSWPYPEDFAGGEPGPFARTYYRVKPFIPPGLRWAIRRWRAKKVARQSGDIWPINEAAGAAPPGWAGWPEGHRFALVLTHDVESAAGVAKIPQLVELESSFGLRSSFNFIPEGSYPDPVAVRNWLGDAGYEVGVHDLYHDGRLYESRSGFVQKAARINDYLERWGAVGFRSGFMLRRLDWLDELDICYDASTFDTDPFEPQPTGTRTIFPFMVNPSGRGGEGAYVELPYTLPQDSSLFLLLGEKTIDVWKRKLDWIAGHGGLALVNIHPDYIDFDGREPSGRSYASERVREFLEYVSESYRGAFWNPLPRELSSWFRKRLRSGERPA